MDTTIYVNVPTAMVEKYVKDFELLPGGEHRESVLSLRSSVMTVLFTLWENPEFAEQMEYHNDFVKALAMREALCQLGIFYDA